MKNSLVSPWRCALLLAVLAGWAAVQAHLLGPADAPLAETVLSRRRLHSLLHASSDTDTDTAAVRRFLASEAETEGFAQVEEASYVGEVRHDGERRRLESEDLSLPLPLQVHALGHSRLHPHNVHQTQARRRRLHEGHGEQSARRSLGEDNTLPSLLTPLYQGYGTHFSYVYIGTPPQRQSVIVDTGSHYTAFPCTGCSQCGQHTDNYWDPNNSTTIKVQQCPGQDGHCAFGQSYSEGSSWRAYKVVDRLWVGGLGLDTVPRGPDYSIPFMFGCQTSETGLFRTQLADGIMGMAMSVETLPSQLVEHRVAKSNIFAMCFRVGGGIMTLGGVDQRIHSKGGVQYAAIRETDGWYTVEVMDVSLLEQGGAGAKRSIGVAPAKYNGGKGVIVDSGTTDTYLPQAVAAQFKAAFKAITGAEFSPANVKLSEEQLLTMPDVVYTLKGTDGRAFDVVMPWTSYIDKVGTGLYAFRIYLTEGSGAVLGANFMSGYNVVFDKANRRVGFAKSDCVYEEFQEQPVAPPTYAPSASAAAEGKDGKDGGDQSQGTCEGVKSASKECTARCSLDEDAGRAYSRTGEQELVDQCSPPHVSTQPCTLPCVGNAMVRGVDTCPEKAWGPCLKACMQSREMPRATELAKGTCEYMSQTRSCYSGDCPMQDGDMLVFLDLRVGLAPSSWSYAYAEVFQAAFASLFSVQEQNIELLNEPRSEYFLSAKLHFQVRLRSKDYSTKQHLVSAAQAIPVQCWAEGFGDVLVNALQAQSDLLDGLDYQRFQWIDQSAVEVLNAVALPIGEVRDPIDVPADGDSTEGEGAILRGIKDAFQGKEEYFFVGVGLAVSVIVCCMFYLYFRLHRESAALAQQRLQSSSLAKMVSKLRGWQRGASDQVQFEEGNEYAQVEMGDVSDHGGAAYTANPILSADDDDTRVDEQRQ